MRRVTAIALAAPVILAGACSSEIVTLDARTPPPASIDDLVLPDTGEPDRQPATKDAPAARPIPSDWPDPEPGGRDGAGAEPIGVTDKVTIVINDPDDG